MRFIVTHAFHRHDIFNFSYEPHENVAVIHFLQKITHFAHILQLDRQLYAPKTLHETPLRSFCPNFRSLDVASAIMYGRHLENRISQSLRNLTHSHDPTRATGNESDTIRLPLK
jgi:hypothetical protein